MKLLPKRLQELEAMTPTISPKFSAEMIPPVTPAAGARKYRVTGCAQDLIFSEVNRDTVEVLARNGCEVFTPPVQQCCGSLHAHNGLKAPVYESQPALTVTYHESCHLSHGQNVVMQPRQVLQRIPKLKLLELPEATLCCGSAGIYNLVQPEMVSELLDRKRANIRSTGATVVLNANSGCLLQLINGIRQAGINVRVAHPMTLLVEAYRRNGA